MNIEYSVAIFLKMFKLLNLYDEMDYFKQQL